LILFFIDISAQSDDLIKAESIEMNAEQVVGIDKFKNIYYINNNTIFKLIPGGEILAFQDVLLGDIEKVDILNPNKITVFYKMANTVIILDNRMTEILRLDFNNSSPFANVGFTGTSKDQGLWIYNMDSNILGLYDYRTYRMLFETLPINQEILELKSNFNLCFLRTFNKILVYNIYGSFIGDIEINNFKSFDLFNNELVIHQGESIKFYNQKLELIKQLNFELESYQNLLYANENLYIYNGNELIAYKIKN
jgi:hypothetical protein